MQIQVDELEILRGLCIQQCRLGQDRIYIIASSPVICCTQTGQAEHGRPPAIKATAICHVANEILTTHY